jgi:hypothetical protein
MILDQSAWATQAGLGSGGWGRDGISRDSSTELLPMARASRKKTREPMLPSARQYVEQNDCDREAEHQNSNDRQCAALRGRRVCFYHPHRVRIGARTDCIVERNIGISDAAVSAHHGPSRAVVPFQDRDPSEPPEPTSPDVGQVGSRDTGMTATADAHTRKVRDVRGARLRREMGAVFFPEQVRESTRREPRDFFD